MNLLEKMLLFYQAAIVNFDLKGALMIFIANFKMMLTTPMAVKLVNDNLADYKALATDSTIIICPPATALRDLQKISNQSSIQLGAQTCGPATTGAYTGDISPADLAACGATYCLVGHSERRNLYFENDVQVAAKAALLATLHITPVVCIGETLVDREAGNTLAILERQLTPVLSALNGLEEHVPVLIAYEPVWAIGSGLVPTPDNLSTIFSALSEFMAKKVPTMTYKLLYGGSVSSKTVISLTQVKHLDGLLIGGASLDFQEFKKIVDYFHCPASN